MADIALVLLTHIANPTEVVVVLERSVDPIAQTSIPCLHVGYHKCASTTLQKAYFDRHPQIAALRGSDRDPRGPEPAIDTVVKACHTNPNKHRNGDLKEAKRRWREAISEALAAGRLPVFSWERLTRHFLFESSTDQRLPRTLKSVVGDAKIVVVIRNQLGLLESRYLAAIKPPSYIDPGAWLDKVASTSAYGYCFADVIQSYQTIFGEENVLVLLFEDLGTDPEGFGRRLSTFIGVDPELGANLLVGERMNARPSAIHQAYARFRHKVLPGISLGRFLPQSARDAVYGLMSAKKGSAVEFPQDQVAKLEDYFRQQNRVLVKRFGLDLEGHGYPL